MTVLTIFKHPPGAWAIIWALKKNAEIHKNTLLSRWP